MTCIRLRFHQRGIGTRPDSKGSSPNFWGWSRKDHVVDSFVSCRGCSHWEWLYGKVVLDCQGKNWGGVKKGGKYMKWDEMEWNAYVIFPFFVFMANLHLFTDSRLIRIMPTTFSAWRWPCSIHRRIVLSVTEKKSATSSTRRSSLFGVGLGCSTGFSCSWGLMMLGISGGESFPFWWVDFLETILPPYRVAIL